MCGQIQRYSMQNASLVPVKKKKKKRFPSHCFYKYINKSINKTLKQNLINKYINAILRTVPFLSKRESQYNNRKDAETYFYSLQLIDDTHIA